MPDIQPYEHLVELAIECGLDGVSWQEVESWLRITGYELRLWEIHQIKLFSIIYHSSAQQYEGTLLPAPYRDVDQPSGMIEDARNTLRNSRF